MMVLLAKIASNIILKKVNLSCLNGPRRVSADGYITVLKFQMEICKDGRGVNIVSSPFEVQAINRQLKQLSKVPARCCC